MEQLYCTIFIVDVSQNSEEVDTITSRIVQLIEDHGGVIKRNNPWGKRRLAYPIRKRTSGFYVEIEFTANSHLNIPHIVENEYRLNDRVLRYLTYVVTKKELIQRELNAKRKHLDDEEEDNDLQFEERHAAARSASRTGKRSQRGRAVFDRDINETPEEVSENIVEEEMIETSPKTKTFEENAAKEESQEKEGGE
jgi:small subunit ribosomal protein S6